MREGKILILSDCSECTFRNVYYCDFERKNIEKEDMVKYHYGVFPNWCKLKDYN